MIDTLFFKITNYTDASQTDETPETAYELPTIPRGTVLSQVAASTEIGIDYFLIYKNFDTREEAQHYCSNYLSKIENCLIVDTTKF